MASVAKKAICIAKTSIKKGAKKISKLLSAGETASILHTPPSILTMVEFTKIYLHRGSGIYLVHKL